MSSDAEELIRESLDRLTEDAQLPSGLKEKVRRRVRLQRAVRYGGGAGAAALAAATAALLVTSGAGPAGNQAPSQTFLVSHVTSALAAPSRANDVVYTRSTGTGGFRALDWSDQTAYRTKLPNLDSVYTTLGKKYTVESVYYPGKAWWRRTVSAPAPGPVAVAEQIPLTRATAACHSAQPLVTTGFGWSAFIRAMLACGSFMDLGRAQVNGISTLELAGHTKPVTSSYMTRRTTVSFDETLWVNAKTYLPVRISWNMHEQIAANRQGREFHWSGTTTMQTVFQWLPPTAANLAQLTIQVPSGFTRVYP